MSRAPGRAPLLVAPIGLLVGALLGAADPDSGVRVERVLSGDVFGRLRIFAREGDWVLRSRAATAAVRAEDGVLVDFFPHDNAGSTTPQLGSATDIDGLWMFESFLLAGGKPYALNSRTSSASKNALRVTARLEHGASRVVVETTYELAADSPRVFITSRIEHESGPAALELELEDSVRWGNVVSYADRLGALPPSFEGRVHFVGRKGASGDLRLRREDEAAFDVAFTTDHAGFRPPIRARYGRNALSVGASTLVRRVLEYASIPDAPGTTTERAKGRVKVTVLDEGGAPLPAKLSFRGVAGTADPDFGDEGDLSGANRFVFSGTGRFERSLTPGRYEVLATAGMERAAERWTADITPGKVVELQGRLPRVLETPGWISADLHLHQAPSVDADISFAARVVSVAAEGIELAVATDHYAVTDLAPTVDALRRNKELSRPLRSLPGTEVSTTGSRFGHFNVFPVAMNAHFTYHDTTPERLFAEVRATAPEALLQVNHPRWASIGYFTMFEMDRKTGEVPAHRAGYSPAFDVIEVYNGLDVGTERGVHQALADFRHLLAKGRRYTATGNSDSHKLFFIDPGLPRNFIRYGASASDEDDVEAPLGDVIKAIRDGKVLVTSGPFIDARVGTAEPGDTARIKGGQFDLGVRVRAAPWIDVRRITVFVGSGDQPALERAVSPSKDLVRFEDRFRLRTDRATFVIVLAEGDAPLPNVYAKKARPMAFTNPIWIAPEET